MALLKRGLFYAYQRVARHAKKVFNITNQPEHTKQSTKPHTTAHLSPWLRFKPVTTLVSPRMWLTKPLRCHQRAGNMSQRVKALATIPENLSLVPGTWWKERGGSCKLPSDLHVHAVHVCAHMHIHTQN